MHRGSILILFIAGLFLMSCSSDELAELRAENARLRKALQEYDAELTAMHNMSVWLDSIDVSRQASPVDDNSNSTTPSKVSSRLQDVNRYVVSSEEKLTGLEDALRLSKQDLSRYQQMIVALQNAVSMRDEQINDLKVSLSVYEQSHRSLTYNTLIRRDSLTAMHEELSLLQAKMDGLIAHARLKEGDVMYAKAKAAEEVVKRSRSTVNEKRDAYREALEVFKKAFSLGNQESADSIAELEWKLLTDPELHLARPNML